MDWSLAGAVILSGLVIVFLVLVILIAVVKLTGKAAGKEKKIPPVSASASPTMAMAAPVPAAAAVSAVQEGVSGQTVAVIAAAVAAMMEQDAPGVAYAITGIRRAAESRPVWGFAGMLQNTRPF